MADRILIGDKNGRTGVWVSPAGTHATSEGVRMLLDSDLDNLKPHFAERFDVTIDGLVDPTRPGDGWWGWIATNPIYFPALPFTPLVFTAVSTRLADYRFSFPPGVNWDGGNNVLDNPPFRLFPDRIEIDGYLQVWHTQSYFYVWVFANPIEGL